MRGASQRGENFTYEVSAAQLGASNALRRDPQSIANTAENRPLALCHIRARSLSIMLTGERCQRPTRTLQVWGEDHLAVMLPQRHARASKF